MDNTLSIPPSPYSSEDKTLSILCHLSAILGVGFILPLILFLIKKDEAGPVAAHAKEVLNFHISVLIYLAVSVLLVFVVVGIFLLPLIALGTLILAVVAAIKASEGTLYRYPLCIRFIS